MTAALLHTLVTYLEMTTPPAGPAKPLPQGFHLRRMDPIDLPLYRAVHQAVGDPWLWWSRRQQSDAEVLAILSRPGVEVRLLREGEIPAGLVETHRHDDGSVEVLYCGLIPGWFGRGLGAPLLDAALRAAWDQGAAKVWLHTCSLDHEKALAFYEAQGFVRVRDEVEVVPDPRLDGRMPRTCGWLSPGLAKV